MVVTKTGNVVNWIYERKTWIVHYLENIYFQELEPTLHLQF